MNDAGISELLTDPSGAPATYSSKIDVIAVQALTSTMEMDVKQLRGDNTLQAVDALFKDIRGKITFGKFNTDVLLAATTAAATVDTGTTPNQKAVTTLAQFDLPSNWKLEAQSKQVDYVGGDVHFIYPKCIANSMDMFGFNQEDYNNQGMDFMAMPLIGSFGGVANAWAVAVANETAVALV
jgi:hypothetical protein